ncbi:hypothetical protein BG842_09750 [Haladaptatus sp. W1]|uniref:hypothetical protein n=1 Tax=Haladaptatus sp. W1 TaxID=1897478 RepID=UPI0008498069|nr:hypothetical protein [Haladaptatus sp. W1]ODR83392.1 hypothetical protein BG842_09750 [Haladaptatus sp. W1]
MAQQLQQPPQQQRYQPQQQQPPQQQRYQPQQQQPPQQQRYQPQQQQPQQQYQPQQQGQFGQPWQALGEQMEQRFDESFSSEVRTTIHDLDKTASVAEWVKMKAAQRGMPTVVRVADDIEDIAHLEKKLIIRESPFAHPIGQTSKQVLQQGLQELQQHISEPEVQDAVEKTRRSLESIDKGLMSLQTMDGQQQQGGQQFGQRGGQQSQPQQQSTQQFGQRYQSQTQMPQY